jgi:hypothetical protein
MLRQQDVVEQRIHPDAVSYGGWAIDLHPPEGVYSSAPACTQWHSKGVFQIPYRAMYSRDVPNLFLTGRLFSTTHVAFGATRVMATCAHNGQAVGMAAVLCKEQALLPRDLAHEYRIGQLQQRLLLAGQYIPDVVAEDSNDLARSAQISASSTLALGRTAPNGEMMALDHDCAVLLPLQPGPFPVFTVTLEATQASTLCAELWQSAKPGNFTPEVLLASTAVDVAPGKTESVALHFEGKLLEARYVFLVFKKNSQLRTAQTDALIPGILTLHHSMNPAVARSATQQPPLNSGIDTFAFWLPKRRPDARGIALAIDPPLRAFDASQLTNGIARPVNAVNGWVPQIGDNNPWLRLSWPQPQSIQSIHIVFDTDFDHPMESVLKNHPESAMPCCVRSFKVSTGDGAVLSEVNDHHQTRWRLDLPEPLKTSAIVVEILDTWGSLPAIYEVRCH